MKRLKVLAMLCVAAVCTTVLLAGCSASESYTPPEQTPVVSSPTILEDGVLKVGVNASSAPLAGQPSNSTKIVGVDVDVAAALADELGLKLEVVDVGTDPESALSEGRVDIVLGIDSSDDSYDFWYSDSYLPTGVALFAAEGSSATPTASMEDSIAAQLSSKSAWTAANVYNNAQLVTTDSLESAFSSLSSGEVTYVASDLVIGSYAAYTANESVEVVQLLQEAGGYCIGVASENTELQGYIADAISELTSNGIVSVIEAKWLGSVLDISAVPVAETSSGSSEESSDETDGESSDETSDNASSQASSEEGDTESSTSEAGSNAVVL